MVTIVWIVALLSVADGCISAASQASLSQGCPVSARTRTFDVQVDTFVQGFHEVIAGGSDLVLTID